MIATIKAEWRKNRFRPAYLIGTGLIGALTVVAYNVNWYLATHPGNSDRPVLLSNLYPDHVVAQVMNAGFPLGAAMAIVVGAIIAGSEYSWSTQKTMLTQGPGRLTIWAGKVFVFTVWMGLATLVLFALGTASSAIVAIFENHAIVWPAVDDIFKGMGAIWLVFAANGALGLALGVFIRQSAAALGLGLVYLLSIEVIAVRFIDGLNNGAYKTVGNLFVDQNAVALLQSFAPHGTIATSAGQAVTVLFAYVAVLVVIAAGLTRLRDVT
jgi:ABC-type transport system involved in multi-copper enzyme maturation permease subunit